MAQRDLVGLHSHGTKGNLDAFRRFGGYLRLGRRFRLSGLNRHFRPGGLGGLTRLLGSNGLNRCLRPNGVNRRLGLSGLLGNHRFRSSLNLIIALFCLATITHGNYSHPIDHIHNSFLKVADIHHQHFVHVLIHHVQIQHTSSKVISRHGSITVQLLRQMVSLHHIRISAEVELSAEEVSI